jgi:hypothetical protein
MGRRPPGLKEYPYIVVRFACRDCPRMGQYRLAVLDETFGAGAELEDVLGAISSSCLRHQADFPVLRAGDLR